MTRRQMVQVTCSLPECESYGETGTVYVRPTLDEGLSSVHLTYGSHIVGRWRTGSAEVVAIIEESRDSDRPRGFVEIVPNRPEQRHSMLVVTGGLAMIRDEHEELVSALIEARHRVERLTGQQAARRAMVTTA